MGKLKVSKTEYTADMLPTTRRAVFFDVLKLNKLKFSILALIALCAVIPFIFINLFSDAYQNYIYQALSTQTITAEQALKSLSSFGNLTSLIKIIFFVFLSIVLAGLARIIKLFAFEENVSVFRDFGIGIKQNFKQYLLLGIVFGVINFIFDYLANMYNGFYLGGLFVSYSDIARLITCVFLGSMAAYISVTIAVYDVKIKLHFKYATLLVSRNFFKTLLAFLCSIAIYIPSLISNFYCRIIGGMVAGLLTPVVMLGWFCFAFHCLDKSINCKYYPELVGKGLFKPEGEEGLN